MEWVLEILESEFILQQKNNLRRFDICFDFLLPINVILAKFKTLEQKGANFYGHNGQVETQYIWEKKSSKNKRSLIRIYNKIADILGKWKNRLYHDYLLQDNVTRVELEVRREFAQNYTLEELCIWDNLIAIMKNYFRNHTSIFEEYEVDKISLYQKPKEIAFGMIQANGAWLMRVKTFLGHARGLLERWLCPIYALLDKDVIHPTTLRILEKEGHFINTMRSIKQNREEWKDIMDAIKDNENDSH